MKFFAPPVVCGFLLFGAASLLISAQAPSPTPAPATPKPEPAAGQGNGPAPGNAPPARAARRRAADFLAIGAPPDPAAVARGQKIFVPTCGFCHGTNATGGESGPDLVRSVIVLHDNKGSTIGPVVLKGRPSKGMPAFSSMTPEQISDIAAFLKSRTQAAANRMEYKIQNIVTGDAKAGQAFFNGPGTCNKCHSPTGDLARIADKYDPVKLQSKLLYPRTESRSRSNPTEETAPAKATVTLPSGQTETGILEQIDDFNVSLRDSSGDYHSYPLEGRDAVKVQITDPLEAHVALLKKYTDADLHNVLAYLETLK
jgi:cytochrome c oxidase cbb3-type subunit III